jgi:ATP-binding cassette subfamily F protein uup
MGAQRIFSDLSFSVTEGDRVGIIGSNGAGKSTLLRIVEGAEDVDEGEVLRQKSLRISYVSQAVDFDLSKTPLELAQEAAHAVAISEAESEGLARISLGSLEVPEVDRSASLLSGGQQKRLQIALSFCQNPDLMLLDEPTNHLDIESIVVLEKLLSRSPFAWIAVSHDRWFLENAVGRIVDIDPQYPGGTLSVDGGYVDYLERRESFLQMAQKQIDSLSNVVRQETAWLRQGAKARSTKSKHRTRGAFQLMDELSLVRAHANKKTAGIQFQASDRKTKRLIEVHNVSKSFDDLHIVKNLDFKLLAGQALGLLGRNGTGKTTFLRMLTGELEPDQGRIKTAVDLRVSHFRQLDVGELGDTALKRVLAPESDSVLFRGQTIHVASWAKRFRFSFEQLEQPFSSLSGGERARARIANLMLETPDVLILDEPTNDLDIPTLEILEESLQDFGGALVLVTHDRFMINRVCNSFLGLDGLGGAEIYADYEQWENHVLRGKAPKKAGTSKDKPTESAEKSRNSKRSKKLSYNEQREYDGMEERILKLESEVEEAQGKLAQPEVQADGDALQKYCEALDKSQSELDACYQRWAELEEKIS